MLVLGIESSCDECAAALVSDGTQIVSEVVATQIAKHRPYMGVVPELASRLHVELISDVVANCLLKGGISKRDIDAVAVTSKPGLVGSLIVGVNFAKAYAYAAGKPLISVDHILAHLYASQMVERLEYPYLGVLVSGGHTLISVVRDFNDIEILGSSIDDAIGEVYDKVAKFYDIGYPGGVVIDRKSAEGDPNAFAFPFPKLDPKLYRKYDMSFSGLKSAVINQKGKFLKAGAQDTIVNLCASFQKAIIGIIFDKIRIAISETSIPRVCVGGGVAANSLLRNSVLSLRNEGVHVSIPPIRYCTDNAAMVAGIGSEYYSKGLFADMSLSPEPRVDRFKGFIRKQSN